MAADLVRMVWGPVLTATAAVFAAWGLHAFQHRRHRRRRVSKRIFHCTYCNRTYLDDHQLPSTACPRCGNMIDAWIEG